MNPSEVVRNDLGLVRARVLEVNGHDWLKVFEVELSGRTILDTARVCALQFCDHFSNTVNVYSGVTLVIGVTRYDNDGIEIEDTPVTIHVGTRATVLTQRSGD